MRWDDLLPHLAEFPRENGTAALHETARFLHGELVQAGVQTRVIDYVAHPYRLRLAGLLILLGSLLYSALLWKKKPVWALAVALLVPILLIADLDYYVPVFSWIGAQEQPHVEARISPNGTAQQVLLLAAHFDSKTDLLDHVERAPIDLLALPVILLMVAGAIQSFRAQRRRRRSRLARGGVVAALVYGVASFAALTGGVFVGERSHGALDDGAACAVLVRLMERLSERPPDRTEVRALLLSGEEIGVHGSWEYARRHFADEPALPTRVINLELIGATADLAVFGRERFTLRSYEPDARLIEILDAVHRERRGEPLHVTWYGAATDARSFLAHGVPAATVISDLPGHAVARHMHSAFDRRERIEETALDATLEFLLEVVRRMDGAESKPQ